ncbi:MAG TPA: helix-hairpin-helix domain-containing protein [Chryseolinea sp.]|nr:helix-hairpin-helix domain-containing protein [Chryseolinea sp.]
MDSLIALWNVTDSFTLKPREQKAPVQLFSFDPNKIPLEDFMRLGFSKSASATMVRYREKGGMFKVKSDILKMYGVDSAYYEKLYAFINLPEHPKARPVFESKPKPFEKKSIEKFNLNVADTAQLKMIYGIGEKLSIRIIKYRESLGGFIEMNQLKEIYGLDSTVVNRLSKQSFVEDGFSPLKMNINIVGEKELAIHPYISNKVARAIVAYRFQHGEFKAIEDIENIVGVDAETIRKIAPYLKFND